MMERYLTRKSLPLLFSALLLSSGAYANPGPNSDYANVAQATYTEDLIGDPLRFANIVLCHMNNVGLTSAPLDTVYSAWVVSALCDGGTAEIGGESDTSSADEDETSGSQGLDRFNRGRIQVSLSAGDQATVKSHWALKENGQAWAHIVYDTSQSSTTNRMVGYVRVSRPEQYNQLYAIEVDGDTTLFRLEDDNIRDGKKLSFSGWSVRDDDESGYGIVSLNDETWQFGYNGDYYCRFTSGNTSAGEEHCFNRKISLADISVWQYQLFDLEGKRLDFIARVEGEDVNFAKPIEIRYMPTSGRSAGTLLDLRFQSGRIDVDGNCISQRNHETLDCGTEGREHWVQDFTIPGDSVRGKVTAIIDGEEVEALAKWVERSVFMKRTEDINITTAGLKIGLPADEPDAFTRLQLLDPSELGSPVFIGPYPPDGDFNIDPRVIHGEVIRD